MKTTVAKIAVAAITVLTLLFSACKKGDTGPAGPAGPAGTVSVTTTTYTVSTWTNSSIWYTDLNVPALTSSVQATGAVEVFLSVNNGTTWTALPYTYVGSTVDYFMGFATNANQVEIQWTYNGVGSGSSPNSVLGATCQFKIVVVPSSMRKAGVNYHNYSEIKNAYNLKD
jgi:hypothetical protein